MESRPIITSTQHSVPSPDGYHIATLHSTHLSIRKSTTLDLVTSIPLPTKRSPYVCLRWSPTASLQQSSRVLLATTTAVHVYSLAVSNYHATISNGSGGLGPISHADFGADDTEVMVWTSMGANVCVWSLETGRMIAEWRDPKFFASGAVIARGCAWSGDAGDGMSSGGRRRGILALMTRAGPQDTLTLYSPQEYAIIKSCTLPTVDAQGIKWSPDGRWLAVWDAAGMGYEVLVYTADGNLFRTYEGEQKDEEMPGLGVKNVAWESSGIYLAVSGWDGSVIFLNTRTVSFMSRKSLARMLTSTVFSRTYTNTPNTSLANLLP
jgi:WD40 repeat protein